MMDEIRTTAAKKNAPLIKRLGKTASTSTKYDNETTVRKLFLHLIKDSNT